MADDEKRLNDGEEEAVETKDWQWDASAPMANEDFLDISLPEKEEIPTDEISEEEETNETAEQDNEEDSAEEDDDGTPQNNTVPEGCCIICGEKIRNSKSEFYCNECRTKYMKVDYGATHIILSIIMVFAAVIGIVAFVSTAKITDGVKAADRLAKEGKISAASDAYSDVLTTVDELNDRFNAFVQGIFRNADDITFYDSGKNVGKKQAEMLAKTFSLSYDDPDGFFSMVDSAFTEKELNSQKYAEVKGFRDFLDKFYSDYKKMNVDLQNVYNPLFEAGYYGEASPEELKAAKAKALKGVEEYAKANPEIDESTIAYFNYTLLYFSAQNYGIESDDTELYGYASTAFNKSGKYNYIFFQDIASCALTTEKYDDVIKASDNVLKINPSNADAYYYKAVAYVRLQKFEDAIKMCDKIPGLAPDDYDYCSIKANALRRMKQYAAAIDICDSVPSEFKSSEISRQEAIAYYLKGDEENALKYAKESYDSAYAASYSNGTFSLESVNTSALIYKLCGDDEGYESLLETLKDTNTELEDSVKAVISGDRTFEDLFMTGKGDII